MRSIPGHARHAVGRRVGVLGAAECGRRGRTSADVVRRGPRRVRGGRRLLPLLPLLLLGRYGGVLGRGRRRLLARGGALRQLGDLEGLVELAAEELLDLLLALLLLLLVRRAGPGGGRVTTAPGVGAALLLVSVRRGRRGFGCAAAASSATAAVNSVSPSGFRCSGPSSRYIDVHSRNTVLTMLCPDRRSRSRSSSI